MSTSKRRFSLEEDFMNYKTDDLVYGFMRSISTAHPTEKNEKGNQQFEEYLPLKTYKQNKKILASICGVGPKALKARLDKLINAGLVQEKEILANGEKMACYIFPYDYNGRFKLIEREMVEYLVATRNALAIRVYLYLLNCSTQKTDYIFTIGEIKKAFGYSESTKTADTFIKLNLESFQKEGIIKYSTEWQEQMSNKTGNENKTERMVLHSVARKIPVPKKVDEKATSRIVSPNAKAV